MFSSHPAAKPKRYDLLQNDEPVASNGKRMKTTSVKLSSKSLEKALREVSRRG